MEEFVEISLEPSLKPSLESPPVKKWFSKDFLKKLGLLLACWLMWGGGFFIVSIPSALGMHSSWTTDGFPYAVGRLIGNLIAICLTKEGIIASFKEIPNHNRPTWKSSIIVISPFMGTVGFILYDQLLLSGGNISVLSSVTSLYIVIPIVFGFTFFKEKVTIRKIIGILIAIAAILLLSFGNSGLTSGGGGSGDDSVGSDAKGPLLLLGVIISWGIGLVTCSITGKVLPWNRTLIMFFFGYILNIVIVFITISTAGGWQSILTLDVLIKLIGHIISSGGVIIYVKLTTENESAHWAALTSLYAIIPVMLGFIVFKYPIDVFSGCGIALSLVAILFLVL